MSGPKNSAQSATVEQWLRAWESAASPEDAAALFHADGLWRDYLAFGGTLQTVEGHEQIKGLIGERPDNLFPRSVQSDGPGDTSEATFTFETAAGKCKGLVRLEDGLCRTLFTSLEALNTDVPTATNENPFVLIVGGGQAGLVLGARLAHAGVPYLIVDQHARVGDCWRNRYDALVLHDPVWTNHLPYKPFPPDWPRFTPKDMMGDWLESYARDLNLNVRTGTKCTRATYSEDSGAWDVTLETGSRAATLRPKHLIMAVGNSGFPKTPRFRGADGFEGDQMHSSAYRNGDAYKGKNVIVVGANNSAHDIASDLVRCGAHPTLIQRSSTHVIPQNIYTEDMLGAYYSPDPASSVDDGDFLTASIPLRDFERRQIALWNDVRDREKAFYQGLTDAGFAIDFAEDGAGMGAKYRRSASGYYINVGGAALVANGQIAVRSGVGVDEIAANSIRLSSGEVLPADAIVYATGFGSMEDWVARIIGQPTADKIGRCWGYGSGFKGDPGPWEGELRNMWKPTAQDGLWFMGGNLVQTRFYSRYLSLQLAQRFLGLA